MKFEAKLRLKQMGLTNVEIDNIETLPALLGDYQKVVDAKTRDDKIVKLIRQNKSLTAETCILRETLKKVCDQIGLVDADFEAYNQMVEDCIAQVPEDEE